MAVTLKPGKNYNRQKFVVPSESVFTVDFGEMSPNYYRLNNMGDVTLYCATNSLPSQSMYDFKANPLSVANFTEPTNRNKLYIFNPFKKDVNIILTYWSDDFDPTFMAVGEISLNNEGVVETDGIVKGFTCELPAGNNLIGKVEVVGTLEQTMIGNNNALAMLREDIANDVLTAITSNFTVLQDIKRALTKQLTLITVKINGYETKEVSFSDGYLGKITDYSHSTISVLVGETNYTLTEWNTNCDTLKCSTATICNDDGSALTLTYEKVVL